MLYLEDIKIELNCQGFEAKHIVISPAQDSAIVYFESTVKTSDICCPECNGYVYIHDSFDITLKDIPIYPEMPLSLFCFGHRYRCRSCGKDFTENVPFAYPGTRFIIVCCFGYLKRTFVLVLSTRSTDLSLQIRHRFLMMRLKLCIVKSYVEISLNHSLHIHASNSNDTIEQKEV